jgi:hypothetical protein
MLRPCLILIFLGLRERETEIKREIGREIKREKGSEIARDRERKK